MKTRVGRALLVLAFVVGQFVLKPVAACFADSLVLPGYELLQTLPGTTVLGQPFMGVPLGTYDFGGTIGIKNTGNTDTIVQRKASTGPIPDGDTGTVPIEMVALQLQSVAPVDFGLGTDVYFLTLQSARGGPATTGPMNITFNDENGGTFDSFFDVFFDIRKGALDGPIAISNQLPLTSSGAWNRTANGLAIAGVNLNLDGSSNAADFWRGPAPIPEPSTVVVLATMSLVGIGVSAVRGRGALGRRLIG